MSSTVNLTKRRMLVAATRFHAATRYGSPKLVAQTWLEAEAEAARFAREQQDGGEAQEKTPRCDSTQALDPKTD